MCACSELRGPYAWRPRFDDKDTLDLFDRSSDLNSYRNRLETSLADDGEADGDQAGGIIHHGEDEETDDDDDDGDANEKEDEPNIREILHNFSDPRERMHPWKRRSNMLNTLRGETKWTDYEETFRNDAEKFVIIDDCDMYGVSRECRPALSLRQMDETLREQVSKNLTIWLA